MKKERYEQVKIILLAIIAVVVIIRVVTMRSTVNSPVYHEQKSVVPQPGNIFTAPGQTSITIPTNLSEQSASKTSLVFEQTEADLGTVSKGSKASYIYKFTNKGEEPLQVHEVRADQGVSVISWTDKPIPKGGTGEIRVEFTADNPVGIQTKTIHVSANTEPAHTHLTLKADVK